MTAAEPKTETEAAEPDRSRPRRRPRGLGQKCSDRETIPLCAEHHRLDPFSGSVLIWALIYLRNTAAHGTLERGAA